MLEWHTKGLTRPKPFRFNILASGTPTRKRNFFNWRSSCLFNTWTVQKRKSLTGFWWNVWLLMVNTSSLWGAMLPTWKTRSLQNKPLLPTIKLRIIHPGKLWNQRNSSTKTHLLGVSFPVTSKNKSVAIKTSWNSQTSANSHGQTLCQLPNGTFLLKEFTIISARWAPSRSL